MFLNLTTIKLHINKAKVYKFLTYLTIKEN